MKTLVLSISIALSLNNYSSESIVGLDLPGELEFGRTLNTDLNPSFISGQPDLSFFAPSYDAHFDQLGFLERIVVDREKQHTIPEKWNFTWKADLEAVKAAFSTIANLEVVKRDVSKSSSMSSLTDLHFTANEKVYHFYFVDWNSAQKADGLSFISVTAL